MKKNKLIKNVATATLTVASLATLIGLNIEPINNNYSIGQAPKVETEKLSNTATTPTFGKTKKTYSNLDDITYNDYKVDVDNESSYSDYAELHFEITDEESSGNYELYAPLYSGYFNNVNLINIKLNQVVNEYDEVLDEHPTFIRFFANRPSNNDIQVVFDPDNYLYYDYIDEESDNHDDVRYCTQLLTNGDNQIDFDKYAKRGFDGFEIFTYSDYDYFNSGSWDNEYILLPGIEITNPDLTKPTLTLEEGSTNYLYTDVENPLTMDEIKAMYSAYDEADGDLTDDIIFSTTYNPNNVTINGEYMINLSVSDSSGNEATTYLKLFTKDINAPEVDLSYLEEMDLFKLDLSDWGGTIDATESAEINDGIEAAILQLLNDSEHNEIFNDYDTDLSLTYSDVDFTTNNYSYTNNKVANTLTVTDSSGNETETDFEITIYDDVDPELAVATNNISLNYNDRLTADILKNLISYSDNVDKNLTITYDFDDYQPGVVGEYDVYITATDHVNNSTSASITINVTDNEKPKFITNGAFIQVNSTTSKETIERLIRDLYANMDMQNYSLMSIQSNYFNDQIGMPGEWQVISLFEEEETGVTVFDTVNLTVKGDDTTTDKDDTDKDDKTILDTIINKVKEVSNKTVKYVKDHKTAFIAGIIVLVGAIYVSKKRRF